MNNAFTIAKMIAVVVFLAAAGGAWTYQLMVVAPRAKCEAQHLWWADKWRRCVSPVDITTLTGRPHAPWPPGVTPPASHDPKKAQPARP